MDPTPDFNIFVNNTVLDNGTNPDPKLQALGFPTVGILWDRIGTGNGFSKNQFATSFPPTLPAGVPEFSTWLMVLIGFFGVGALLRRARRLARMEGIAAIARTAPLVSPAW
jgi:hypothetical protein